MMVGSVQQQLQFGRIIFEGNAAFTNFSSMANDFDVVNYGFRDDVATPYGQLVVYTTRTQGRRADEDFTQVVGFHVQDLNPTPGWRYPRMEVDTVPKSTQGEIREILRMLGYKEPIYFWACQAGDSRLGN